MLKKENDSQRRAKSQKNQPQQKIVGTRDKKLESEIESSQTQWRSAMRWHCIQLKVALNFPANSKKKKGVSSYWVYNEIPVGFDSPEQSVKALTQTQSKSLSPALSSTFSDAIGASNPLLDLYTAVTRKKDPASSCAKYLILNKLFSKTWSAKKSKDLLKV